MQTFAPYFIGSATYFFLKNAQQPSNFKNLTGKISILNAKKDTPPFKMVCLSSLSD